MRRLLRGLFVLLGFAVPALAQSVAYIYTPLGYQQVSVTSPSALTLTVPTAARIAEICVETAQVRYRDDGTAPTANVGMPAAASQCFQYSGSLVAIQFIAVSTTATLDVSYYR
jgi:hypothetical protein